MISTAKHSLLLIVKEKGAKEGGGLKREREGRGEGRGGSEILNFFLQTRGAY